MSYRSKTYIAFASEDIGRYRLMEAWRDNDNIDFSFFDAHDLYISRDTSLDDTIRRNLRQRMSNAKQFVLLGSADAKKKGADESTFFGYEVKTMLTLDLPIVVANLNDSRVYESRFVPTPLIEANYYTLSVSFRAAVIKYALDDYAPNYKASSKKGPHKYPEGIYKKLGL